jgi:hypothetical protein
VATNFRARERKKEAELEVVFAHKNYNFAD